MSIWISIFIAGLINYLTRLGAFLMINPKKMNKITKQVLAYVPSAVFPAIIFPAVLLENSGSFVSYNDPKIIAILVAILIGYFSKNILVTILSGLISYWIIIFFVQK